MQKIVLQASELERVEKNKQQTDLKMQNLEKENTRL